MPKLWVRVFVVVGLLLVGSLLARADALADPVARVWRIAEAESFDLPGCAAPTWPADGTTWRHVALPDAWDDSRPDHAGCVAYRLQLPALPSGPLAVWLPAAGMNAELRLNGTRVGGLGPLDGEAVPYHVGMPLYFDLPRALLRGDGRDELQLVLASQRVLRAGLAPVWVGDAHALHTRFRAQQAWQPSGALISSALTAALGLYALLLAGVERGRREFAWLGAAALVAALRGLGLVLTQPPMPLLHWLQLVHLGGGWFVGLFAIFSLRLAQREDPGARWPGRRTEWLIGGYLVVRSVWTFTVPSEALLWREWNLQAALPALIALGAAALLTRLAWRRRRGDVAVLACAAWVVIAATAHDVRQLNDPTTLGDTPWRHYAALGLVAAAAVLMARRYADALGDARRLSASLQDEVDRQRAELQLSFERLRESERSQARTQERARLMRDLHDGLGLNLVSAMVQAQRGDLPAVSLAPLLQACLDDLRVAVDSLDDTERNPVELLASLRFRLAPRFEALGMQLAWHVDDALPPQAPLDADAALHLLRIVQEALANALKHSGARCVTLSVTRGGDERRLCIEVRDDGRGAGALPGEGGGRGLAHMRARAKAMGATAVFETSPQGSVLRLDMGLNPVSPPQTPSTPP